jgi:hypothetical protein
MLPRYITVGHGTQVLLVKVTSDTNGQYTQNGTVLAVFTDLTAANVVREALNS